MFVFKFLNLFLQENDEIKLKITPSDEIKISVCHYSLNNIKNLIIDQIYL